MKNSVLVLLFVIMLLGISTSCQKMDDEDLGLPPNAVFTDSPEDYIESSHVKWNMARLELEDIEQSVYLKDYQCANSSYYDGERWVSSSSDCGYWHIVKMRAYWGEVNDKKYYSSSKVLRAYVSPNIWQEIEYQFKMQNLTSKIVYISTSNPAPTPSGEGLSITGVEW